MKNEVDGEKERPGQYIDSESPFYISRKAAVKIAQKYGLGNGSALGRHTGLADCIAIEIEGLPAADVVPVRYGRWEECDWVDVDEHGFGTRRTFKAGLRCSQCACVFKKELLWKRNWCPSCGTKMDLEDESNDD